MHDLRDFALLGAPLVARAPEEPLPTIAEIIAGWGLPHNLAEPVRLIAGAANRAEVHEGSRAEVQALTRAWGYLRRARIELSAGVLPSRQLGLARREIATPLAADVMMLAGELRDALGAIRSASQSFDLAAVAIHLDAAMAAVGHEIRKREIDQ